VAGARWTQGPRASSASGGLSTALTSRRAQGKMQAWRTFMQLLHALGLEDLSEGNTQWLVGLALAVGLLYCFLGYRLFKLVLGLTGFVLAGSVAALLMGWLTQANLLAMGVGMLMGGICGAFALFFVYRAGVFVVGLSAALLIAYNLLNDRPEAWAPWAVVGLGIAGGLLALLIERPAMTFATAAIGAWLSAYGTGMLFLGQERIAQLGAEPSLSQTEWVVIGGWVLLTLLGTWFQLARGRRRPRPPG